MSMPLAWSGLMGCPLCGDRVAVGDLKRRLGAWAYCLLPIIPYWYLYISTLRMCMQQLFHPRRDNNKGNIIYIQGLFNTNIVLYPISIHFNNIFIWIDNPNNCLRRTGGRSFFVSTTVRNLCFCQSVICALPIWENIKYNPVPKNGRVCVLNSHLDPIGERNDVQYLSISCQCLVDLYCTYLRYCVRTYYLLSLSLSLLHIYIDIYIYIYMIILYIYPCMDI